MDSTHGNEAGLAFADLIQSRSNKIFQNPNEVSMTTERAVELLMDKTPKNQHSITESAILRVI